MDKRKKISQHPEPPVQKIDPEVNPMDLDEPLPVPPDPDEIPEDDPFAPPHDDQDPVPGEGP